LFGVLKLGYSLELRGRREEGGHTATYYPQCQAWSEHIDPGLLHANSDWLAEERVKMYEKLVLRLLARFLIDEDREVPSPPTPPYSPPLVKGWFLSQAPMRAAACDASACVCVFVCVCGWVGGWGLGVDQVVDAYDRGEGDEECLALLFKNVVSYVCSLPFHKVAPPSTTVAHVAVQSIIVCRLHCFTVDYIVIYIYIYRCGSCWN
jgi:hypothetical protein